MDGELPTFTEGTHMLDAELARNQAEGAMKKQSSHEAPIATTLELLSILCNGKEPD